MKNTIKNLFYIIICTLLILPIEVGAVGFHSSGGSSSGSSFSGGSSSSGGSDGFNLPSFIMFIILSIILYIVGVIVDKAKRKEAREKQEILKQEQVIHLSEDINFCDELLESQIQNNILDVLYAINDNKIDDLYIYCTDNFIQNHKYIINSLNLDVDHIAWINVEIESINSDNMYDYITLKVSFDIIVENHTCTRCFIVGLKRADKVVTKGLNQSKTLNACKSCGAPMDYKKSYYCDYCGNVSRLSEQDTWMIDDIFKF